MDAIKGMKCIGVLFLPKIGKQHTRRTKTFLRSVWGDSAADLVCKLSYLVVIGTIFISAIMGHAGNKLEIKVGGADRLLYQINSSQFPAKLRNVDFGFGKSIFINSPTEEQWSGQFLTHWLYQLGIILKRLTREKIVFGDFYGTDGVSGFWPKEILAVVVPSPQKLIFGEFLLLPGQNVEEMNHFDCRSISRIGKDSFKGNFFERLSVGQRCPNSVEGKTANHDKWPLNNFQRLSVGIIGIGGCIGCLPSTPSYKNIGYQETTSNTHRRNFGFLFPLWGIVLAPIGLILLAWGWWNWRDGLRLPTSKIFVWTGFVLWLYGFAVILTWSIAWSSNL